MQQALKKRLPVSIVEAKTAPKEFLETTRKLGDVVKITSLENKDRDCARIIVNSIPEGVSVSGPDYLGAHLSLRETYAIFPALSKEADYVIVDVFSRKILTILNLDPTLIKQSVKDISQSPEYQLDQSCGNLFVFKKVAKHERSTQIPIQESYRYPTKYNFPIYGGLSLVDFRVPEIFRRNQPLQLKFTYTKEEQLSDYSLFFTMINKGDGEIYQIANLPSFAIFEPENWVEGYYYTENLEMVVPSYLNGGSYETYVGMTNNIKNRSVYLGDVELR